MHHFTVHSPERQPGESQTDYRARQRASKHAAQAMTLARVHRQHREPSSREKLRGSLRRNGKLHGTFAFGVCNAAAVKRAGKLAKTYPLRDRNGAYTLTGSAVEFVGHHPGPRWHELGGSAGPGGFTKDARRIWLAGISAQRGY